LRRTSLQQKASRTSGETFQKRASIHGALLYTWQEIKSGRRQRHAFLGSAGGIPRRDRRAPLQWFRWRWEGGISGWLGARLWISRRRLFVLASGRKSRFDIGYRSPDLADSPALGRAFSRTRRVIGRSLASQGRR